MAFFPIIISGGTGTRLWPLSREAHPKPFLALPDGSTLITRTYERLASLDGAERMITVTNRDLLFLTADAYADAKAPELANEYLLEPAPRDTTAAIALAAIHLNATVGPDAILVVMPSDHLVHDQAAFAGAVERAVEQAKSDRIVTFGVTPERPETAYGYIETHGTEVVSFKEKPDEATAAQFVESGRYLWNAGMFCFRADTMLTAMGKHCPDILDGAQTAYETAKHSDLMGSSVLEFPMDPFSGIEAISIDHAVMEKTDRIACQKLDCGWTDVGSWTSYAELLPPDENGNRITGTVVQENSSDSFVHAEDRLVGLVGVSDLLVIDTPDALLVARRGHDQAVKGLAKQLSAQGHEAAKLHRTAHRPWGTYTVLEEGSRFKIKRIVVKPGAKLSLQSHHHRSEHWVVVSGTARVVNGEDEILLTTNQSTYIPCGHTHRLENPGILPLILIEVQTGDYLGEDDIVRYDDTYGRP
ncbi:mannose-1-phosphate guanylyltransferase/mannose-6-phosphate isomerase [Cucumibacter marinus]|uniref:mannose-1-phosphate guanylyltransferase/mannose-6-phosphate isomerase n=1 Tax=Cucumibacter marinus TaxID=1121252 RepID=UPI0004024610|nr:mannose-1-phosphate guanylyltransferase/mannose-6-phosphate isomerase [Cucumibacter marinus]